MEAVVKLRVGVAENGGVGEEFPGSLKNLQFVHNCIIMESHVNLWTIILLKLAVLRETRLVSILGSCKYCGICCILIADRRRGGVRDAGSEVQGRRGAAAELREVF